MGKGNTVEDRLARVQALRSEPASDKLRAHVLKAMKDKSNLVVGAAAEIVAEHELSDFEGPLLDAWQRFLEDPVKRDKGCVAKTAIVEALLQSDYDEPDFYREGMQCTQFEPAWGAPNDAAVNVRGGCALGLARSRWVGANAKLVAITDLLADGNRLARVHAVRALAETGSEFAIPLLRLKVLCGDPEVEVVGACFSALLELAPDDSLAFVAEYLKAKDEDVVLEAAAVLGESGRPAAVAALIDAWRRAVDAELRRSLLISIGLSRQSGAVDFLVSLIERETRDSEQALEALAPSRFYPDIVERVRDAVAKTDNGRLEEIFEREFRRS